MRRVRKSDTKMTEYFTSALSQEKSATFKINHGALLVFYNDQLSSVYSGVHSMFRRRRLYSQNSTNFHNTLTYCSVVQ